MFDHVTLGVHDIDAARSFYGRVMETLGHRLLWETGTMLTYGDGGEVEFGLQLDGDQSRPGTHVAFHAETRETVRRFHEMGLASGGADDGAPGLRPEYHPRYFAAFLRDPSGNRLEAVCHGD